MSTDLSKIRLSLKGCEEVILPYKFPPRCWIKYITLKDDDEVFYEGGEFLRLGDHKLFISEGGRTKCIDTCKRTDDGIVIYKTRFFIDPNKQRPCKDEKSQLNKVIKAQQQVIKQSSTQIKILEDKTHDFQIENYELRTELEETNHQVKELLIKEKKYKLLLSQYI